MGEVEGRKKGCVGRQDAMEVKNIPLRDIKIDPLAEELANSEEAPLQSIDFTSSGKASKSVQSAAAVQESVPRRKSLTAVSSGTV